MCVCVCVCVCVWSDGQVAYFQVAGAIHMNKSTIFKKVYQGSFPHIGKLWSNMFFRRPNFLSLCIYTCLCIYLSYSTSVCLIRRYGFKNCSKEYKGLSFYVHMFLLWVSRELTCYHVTIPHTINTIDLLLFSHVRAIIVQTSWNFK